MADSEIGVRLGVLGRIIINPGPGEWSWTNNTGVPLRVVLVKPGEVHLEPAGSGDLAAPGECVTIAAEDVNVQSD